MWPEVVATACALSAVVVTAGWLKTSVRLAQCRRENQELAKSSLVTEFEKHLLELMARGMPLNQLLDNIALAIEAMATDCACTVMLLDEDNPRILLSAAGPSLPAECMQALSGLEIGPNAGACGSAVFLNDTVIAADIATDHRFAPARNFFLSYGLRSAWSVPIRNLNGVVQGTFAMFHRQPSTPLPAELQMVEAGARLAGNVIERLRSEQRLRETAERLAEAHRAAEAAVQVAQHAQRLELDRKNLLELVAKDRPLEEIASAISRAISHHLPLSSCSVQIELAANARLSVSPLLPEAFARALARIPIASIRETSAAAAVVGLSDHPEWQQNMEFASELSEQSYLAAPVFQNGLVAGMIIALLPGEKLATAADGELLASWAQFAGLAIERRGLYEKLSFRAQYDELTHLLNRASLHDRMNARRLSAGDESMAVLYFDLDSFKAINDRHGHAAGDAVLRDVSRRVLAGIRGTDVAARVGGDEFVILLPGVSERADARRMAELIGRVVSEPIEFDGLQLRVGSSTGIAMYPDDGRDTETLLKIADEDMYRTKMSRRSSAGQNVHSR